MPDTQRVDTNDATELPGDLQQLIAAIQALPEKHASALLPLADRVAESTSRRRRILTLVQDALSQLRLDMKYLMFDLEATRREREELRQRLDQNEL